MKKNKIIFLIESALLKIFINLSLEIFIPLCGNVKFDNKKKCSTKLEDFSIFSNDGIIILN